MHLRGRMRAAAGKENVAVFFYFFWIRETASYVLKVEALLGLIVRQAWEHYCTNGTRLDGRLCASIIEKIKK
jgi:hypothetical protein